MAALQGTLPGGWIGSLGQSIKGPGMGVKREFPRN